MLLIAVLMMVPVLDALSCALEPATGHGIEMVAGDSATPPGETDDAASDAHELCAHNHCHHSMASIAANVAVAQDMRRKDALMAFHDNRHAANFADGLMRPPRT